MKTALFEAHRTLGAKIVDFGGWEMPIQYKGIIHEHLAVRQHAGIFDVSHMGRILIEGKDAEEFLDYLSTNAIKGKNSGTCTYTVWCNSRGTCVDDLIVYKQEEGKFFVVVNAANRQKDLEHVRLYAKGWNVTVTDRYQEDGILALQGPDADAVAGIIFPCVDQLKPMELRMDEYKSKQVILSRTGYTGAGGIELVAANEVISELWDVFLSKGKTYGIEPIGLGARDTLRLEMGYALYGHEISEAIYPSESVAAWTVKWDKTDFLGKKALDMLKESSLERFEHGIILTEPGIPREGYEVLSSGRQIGIVTSGTFSPSLNQPIAIVLVERKLHVGDHVEVKIRSKVCNAKVMGLPFYK